MNNSGTVAYNGTYRNECHVTRSRAIKGARLHALFSWLDFSKRAVEINKSKCSLVSNARRSLVEREICHDTDELFTPPLDDQGWRINSHRAHRATRSPFNDHVLTNLSTTTQSLDTVARCWNVPSARCTFFHKKSLISMKRYNIKQTNKTYAMAKNLKNTSAINWKFHLKVDSILYFTLLSV